MKSFVLTKEIDRAGQSYKIGTHVYEFDGYDYGLSIDDTLACHEPYVSVTLSPDHITLPFFTVPRSALVECKPESPAMAWTVNQLINRPTAVYAK